jgi:hypothetical protein
MSEHEYLFISGLFKAEAAEEGGERVIYMEASNESVDLQGERVLAKSLRDSADHFLKYGNIDLDHRTLRGSAAPGDNPYLWEVGRPLEVTANKGRTLVKAAIYKGEGKAAENANLLWDSMTRLSPPARWYPSVGGQILERGSEIDPLTKATINLVKRVRWTNIGLSRTPVNHSVPAVATVAAEVFAKCLNAEGCLNLSKALEAGHGADSATLNGGAALRSQSLDPVLQATLPGYDSVKESLARAASHYFKSRGSLLDSDAKRHLVEHLAGTWGVDHSISEILVDRFLDELRGAL